MKVIQNNQRLFFTNIQKQQNDIHVSIILVWLIMIKSPNTLRPDKS